MNKESDNWYTLRQIWEIYDLGSGKDLPAVTLAQLLEWGRNGRREQVDFPAPKKKVSRYYLFDRYEVAEWYKLWCRATRRS